MKTNPLETETDLLETETDLLGSEKDLLEFASANPDIIAGLNVAAADDKTIALVGQVEDDILWAGLEEGRVNGQSAMDGYFFDHIKTESQLMAIITHFEEFVAPLCNLIDDLFVDPQVPDEDLVSVCDLLMSFGRTHYFDLKGSNGKNLFKTTDSRYYTAQGRYQKANFSIQKSFQLQLDRFQVKQ